MPYASGFEAAVGNFLQSYAAMRGLRQQERESDRREKQANRADQLAQIQMGEAGYEEFQMPEIQAPPGQNFAQKVGRFLSGPQKPGSVVMKTHQSTREREIEAASAAHVADREDTQSYGLELEAIRAVNARKLEQERNAGDMARTRMNNETSIRVAGIQKQPNAQDAAKDEIALKHQFVDDALAAADGDPIRAMQQVTSNPNALSTAQRLKLNRFDYGAAAQRFAERKAVLLRETNQSRENIADKRNASKDALRQRLLAPTDGAGVNAALSAQRAEWDRAATYARSVGKDPAKELGPRP